MLKYLPNALTMSNLLCGCLGIWYGVHGEVFIAALLVLGSAFFDFLDGFAARLTGYSSPLGKDLDSLADVVSFGVSPALMTFAIAVDGDTSLKMISSQVSQWPIFLVLLIPVASAYRLAVFNHDQSQSDTFKGLPTPANGIFWAFFALGLFNGVWGNWVAQPISLGIISLLFSWLMISRLSLLSLKGIKRTPQSLTPLLVIAAVALPLMYVLGLPGLAPSILLYIIVSIAAYKLQR